MAKICVITNDLSLGGGVFTKLTAFLRYAASRHHVCDLFFPSIKKYPAEEVEFLKSIGNVKRVYSVPVPEKAPHFVRSWIFGKRCKIPEEYDAYQLVGAVMHLCLPFVKRNLPFVPWVANPYAVETRYLPRTKIRHYYFYNGLNTYLVNRLERLCGSKARCVIVESRYTSQQRQLEEGIPEEKIRIIGVPVDIEKFRPGEAVNDPRRYILSVGRLGREKGFSTLIKAFRSVVSNMDGIELRIAGDGKERKDLEREVESFGLEKHVVFLGHVLGDKLIEQYRGATIFSLASPKEGFGSVYLEAMACGKPVVATDSGAVQDMVIHGHNGFLVKPHDWQNLAQYILQVLNDPDLASNMGKRSRRKAVEEFSYEVIGRRLDTIYSEVFGVQPGYREEPSGIRESTASNNISS